VLLPGRPLPLHASMSMLGKDRPPLPHSEPEAEQAPRRTSALMEVSM
jgi:hypothetical protein